MSSRTLSSLTVPSSLPRSLGVSTPSAWRSLLKLVKESNTDGVRKWVEESGSKPHLNYKDDSGKTVIHLAAEQGDVEILALLLQLPGTKVDVPDKQGRNPIHLAAEKGHIQSLFLLLELGGLGSAEHTDLDGFTALHHAAAAQELHATRALIDAGCSLFATDHEGRTALLLGSRGGDRKVIQLLVNAGSVVNHVDLDGMTSLMLAARKGHSDGVEVLLDAKADANLSDLNSNTALSLAISYNHVEAAKKLAPCVHDFEFRGKESRPTSPKVKQTMLYIAEASPHFSSVHLTRMELGGPEATVLLGLAGQMQSLKDLDLSSNFIDVTLDFSSIGGLEKLDLSNNLMRDFPVRIEGLSSLKWLSVAGNEFEQVPAGLGDCLDLEHLDLSGNLILSLPNTLCRLEKLEQLNLNSNRLTNLPESFEALTSLKVLEAKENAMCTLPSLPLSLQTLDLSSNELTEISPQLGRITGLSSLDLEQNKLEILPANLVSTDLRNTQDLGYHGNPLGSIPPEMLESPETILGFLGDLYEGVEQVLFIRVMIMGEGGAGKTSVLRCIQDPDVNLKALLRQPRLPDTGGSTLGVEVERVEAKVRVCDANVSMQFWDLAGQACYLVGHALLFSDRILPVYVFDGTRSELDAVHDANKWLDTLMLTLPPGSSSSPATPNSKVSSPSFGVDDHHGDQGSRKMEGEGQAEDSDEARQLPPVTIVLIATRVEKGLISREDCSLKLESIAEDLIGRTKKLHGRVLLVKGMLGVSNSTRECFDAKNPKVDLSFAGVLQKVGEAALSVIYTDQHYPRGLIPTSYSKLRKALQEYANGPVENFEYVVSLAERYAGILDQGKLSRALAMLRCWGVIVYISDSPQLNAKILQARWCSELVYTLFMCAHWKGQGTEGSSPINKALLENKVDLERLAACDPGGAKLQRGIVTAEGAEAIFSKLAKAAGQPNISLCLALLEHVGIMYKLNADAFIVPSLFQNEMPPQLRRYMAAAARQMWSTRREYKFNILPHKIASRITVRLCATTDVRTGAASIQTWGGGMWLQEPDGSAVMLETNEGGRALVVNSIEKRTGRFTSKGGWAAVVQSILADTVSQFSGVVVEAWLRCPHKDCREMLPYARLDSAKAKSFKVVGEIWSGAQAMCGRVPAAHAYPSQVWITGMSTLSPTVPPTAEIVGAQSAADPDVVEIHNPHPNNGNRQEEEVLAVSTAGALALGGTVALGIEDPRNSFGSIARVPQSLEALGTHAAVVSAEDHFRDEHGADDWWEEGIEATSEMAKTGLELGEYLKGSEAAHTELIATAVEASLQGLSYEGLGDVSSAVHEVMSEVEYWAPVCTAVFGVLGAIFVASERGKSNEYNRQRFYERMVSVGRSLLEVRATFSHAPPPQMQPLLLTLESSLRFIKTFDDRSWIMRALKSGSDKAAFERFDAALTGYCSDMSISLQATAYRDEHAALREIVDRIGGLETLARAPQLQRRIEDLARIQEEQMSQQQQLASMLQILIEQRVLTPASPNDVTGGQQMRPQHGAPPPTKTASARAQALNQVMSGCAGPQTSGFLPDRAHIPMRPSDLPIGDDDVEEIRGDRAPQRVGPEIQMIAVQELQDSTPPGLGSQTEEVEELEKVGSQMGVKASSRNNDVAAGGANGSASGVLGGADGPASHPAEAEGAIGSECDAAHDGEYDGADAGPSIEEV